MKSAEEHERDYILTALENAKEDIRPGKGRPKYGI
jgi:hypothetical protein